MNYLVYLLLAFSFFAPPMALQADLPPPLTEELKGTPMQTLCFPKNRSVGRLYIGNSHEFYSEAQGRVAVPKTTHLHLVLSNAEKDLSFLKHCTNTHLIQSLDLTEAKLSDQALVDLKYLPSLTSLNLTETKASDEGLKHLCSLKKLKKLRLGGFIESGKITGAGIQTLADNLSNLEILELIIWTGLDKSAIQNLLKFSRLTTLSIYSDSLKGGDIIDLQHLKSLRYLTLGYMQDIRIEHLSEFRQLKELDLCNIYHFLSPDDQFGIETPPEKASKDLQLLRKALPSCKITAYRLSHC